MSWELVGNIQGPPGPPGVLSPDAFIKGEAPTGAINGSNKLYTTAYNYVAGSLEVYLNGLRQRETDDYDEVGSTQFQFVLAPFATDSISVDYLRQAVAAVFGETPAGAIDGVNKNFTTAQLYAPLLLAVYLSGLRLRRTDDYTETSNNTFQLVNAPLSSDSLSVDYIQQ